MEYPTLPGVPHGSEQLALPRVGHDTMVVTERLRFRETGKCPVPDHMLPSVWERRRVIALADIAQHGGDTCLGIQLEERFPATGMGKPFRRLLFRQPVQVGPTVEWLAGWSEGRVRLPPGHEEAHGHLRCRAPHQVFQYTGVPSSVSINTAHRDRSSWMAASACSMTSFIAARPSRAAGPPIRTGPPTS